MRRSPRLAPTSTVPQTHPAWTEAPCADGECRSARKDRDPSQLRTLLEALQVAPTQPTPSRGALERPAIIQQLLDWMRPKGPEEVPYGELLLERDLLREDNARLRRALNAARETTRSHQQGLEALWDGVDDAISAIDIMQEENRTAWGVTQASDSALAADESVPRFLDSSPQNAAPPQE